MKIQNQSVTLNRRTVFTFRSSAFNQSEALSDTITITLGSSGASSCC